MTLGDREILELNELCGAAVDGVLTDAQRARLAGWLRESEAARRFYVRALGQAASLHQYAAEIHAEAPDARPAGRVVAVGWWVFGALAVAAALVLGFFARRATLLPDEAPPLRASDSVARITALKNPRWRGAVKLAAGDHLRKGQRLEIGAGFAEITFDSGARVVLEGAATLDVNSAWDATLRDGTLKASVPPEAVGFRVVNSAVEVVDLGTEFTMVADGRGGADVFVLKGEVEAAPRLAAETDTLLLRENQSRRFGQGGVSAVTDSAKRFAEFTQPLALDRFSPPVNFVHWSFDQIRSGEIAAEIAGIAVPADAAAMRLFDVVNPAAARPAGPHGHALPLDGHAYARAKFPGLSGATPHTIAFWIRVPEDAQLSEAYTMVAWGTNLKKLSHRPVQVSWNRRPAEGALGALRTDFGGGSAIGTTSLRDGRWHHVTVCFAAGEDPEAPVQVKQYIDGRLESSTINPGKIRATGSPGDEAADFVWLGRRLTGNGPGQPESFRGDIDELFIADRALEPNEIVAVMKDNRLPRPTMVANLDSARP